jgi:hypothetical protein
MPRVLDLRTACAVALPCCLALALSTFGSASGSALPSNPAVSRGLAAPAPALRASAAKRCAHCRVPSWPSRPTGSCRCRRLWRRAGRSPAGASRTAMSCSRRQARSASTTSRPANRCRLDAAATAVHRGERVVAASTCPPTPSSGWSTVDGSGHRRAEATPTIDARPQHCDPSHLWQLDMSRLNLHASNQMTLIQ